MSSYSRPLFRLFPTSLTAQRSVFRRFHPISPCLRSTLSTTGRCSAKKTRAAYRSPKPPPRPGKAPPLSTYKPFAQIIVERSEPTLLYQGGSNKIYITGCYSVGVLILGWAVHAAGQMYYHPPPFFNRFLKSMFYGFCVIAVYMGTLFMIRVGQYSWTLKSPSSL